MKKRTKFYVLIVTLFVATIIRLLYIRNIPPSLTNDELNIVMNAQSVLITGKNIPGVTTGITGNTGGDLSLGIHSEISSYLIAPFVASFGLNSISIKIPFILASLGIIIIGYLLVKNLIGENAGIVAMMLLAVNPWLIFFGRSAYESILSSFFYLLSVYLILHLAGWKKVFAIIPLLAGFLSYFSAKTLMFPITFIMMLWFWWFDKSKNIKPLIALNIATLTITLCYGIAVFKNPEQLRLNELKSGQTSQTVITKRTTSLNGSLNYFFENKYTEELRVRLTRSFGMFSPVYLFIDGQPEATPSLSIPDHGFLYFIDMFLIIAGVIFLLKQNHKQLVLIIGLVATTLIPNFLDLQGTTYSIRTVILFPTLTILSAIGLYSIKNKLIKTIVIFIYVLMIANFLFIYFHRLPIERSGGWFLPQKVVSEYIAREEGSDSNQKIILISQDPKLIFYKFLFYNGKYQDNKQVKIINDLLAKQDYTIGNLLITDDCNMGNNYSKNTTLITSGSLCKLTNPDSTIKSVSDAGDIYFIYNDRLCVKSSRNQYPLINTIEQLNMEKQTKQEFCSNYISDFLLDTETSL